MADHLPVSGAGPAPDARPNPAAALNGARTAVPLDEASGGLTAGQLVVEEAVIRAELAPLAGLRLGLPEPRATVLAAARDRLLNRAAQVSATGAPAAAVPTDRVPADRVPADRVRADGVLADGAVAAPTTGPDAGPGRAARHRRRLRPRVTTRRVIAVAVAAVVVAAGLFTLDTVTVGGRADATAEASTLLRQAASVVAAKPDPPVGPTQYREITTRASYGSSTTGTDGREVTWLVESVTRLWIPGDPTKPWIMQQGGPTAIHWFNPADETWAKANGLGGQSSVPYLTRAVGGEFNGPILDIQAWQAPTPGFLSRLPRDPDKLLARIYHDSEGEGRSKDGEALVFIADVMRCGFVPADLRAAFFRAATGIPGVTVTDHAANLAGRTGVAVGRDEGGDTRQEMIFDPATGQFIGEREVVLNADYIPGVPVGTAISYTAVSSEVVDSAPTG
ncbi:CU044_5270 family protein [Frankia sp. AgB1.9]|uniref:CU044_5270 family protein n=1 Tax=unclassified Frankia TaxID=2632575 RepID=UPI001933DAB4|nr:MULTISPECIES: CU044_5270 family protein [unclassified Frankia]MBL7488992.1 CU044_5270 family protein [Frankia sp. AgW1.1]MBL7546838.1 CU044_5270 family protein [Frankia sp. AgB1.9]MBL7622508.1 CU044_5270 family protein [Frankia sp. AgB1.8]